MPGPRTRFGIAAAIVAAALATTACAPELNWREVHPEGGGLRVLLPCKPDRQTRPLQLAGATVEVQLLACTAKGTTWSVIAVETGDVARAQPALAELRAARARNLDGRERGSRLVQLAGPAGSTAALRLEVEGHRPDGEAVLEHSLLFTLHSRVFHVAALGGQPSQEALDSLFASVTPVP